LLVIGVAAIAAPLLLLWLEEQSALQPIAMHMAQLLDPLALASQIEIVESALPGMGLFRPELGLASGSAVRRGGVKINVKISLRLDLAPPMLNVRRAPQWPKPTGFY
jgi:hypothetical protein